MVIERFIVSSLIVLNAALCFFYDAYRPFSLNWGATEAEIQKSMPGDELLQNPSFNATRAVTIRAQSEEVWSWIIQMGYKKAGFYSYDLLDNARIPSSRRIIP